MDLRFGGRIIASSYDSRLHQETDYKRAACSRYRL